MSQTLNSKDNNILQLRCECHTSTHFIEIEVDLDDYWKNGEICYIHVPLQDNRF